MQRMSGIDASFLYMEAPHVPMHTIKRVVLDMSDISGGYSFARVLSALRERLDLLPALRWRALEVPLGLHHPVWIEDPDFRLEDHVHRISLPGGAGRELDALTAWVASPPLDRRRPLWDLWVVEGLRDPSGGRRRLVGFIARVHHALADGLASSEMLRRVMMEGVRRRPKTRPQEALPEPRELLKTAVREHIVQLTGLPRLLRETIASGLRSRLQSRRAGVRTARLFAGPRTVFNRGISPRRAFLSLDFSLARFKQIRAAFSCTINDVVLAVVAGALRRYLHGRGERVDFPLVASVPATTSARRFASGNHVSSMYAALPVHLEGPVARLSAIVQATAAAKSAHRTFGEDMLMRWLEFSRRAPHALLWHHVLPHLSRPPIHLVVSNVPGPSAQLAIDGARLVHLASVGPLLEGVGLNVTVWSYVDTMCFSVLTCPDCVPDVRSLGEALRASLDDLQSAAEAVAPAPAQGAAAGT